MPGRIRLEKRGALGFLVFDHPERRNAITQQMWRAIPDAAAELGADPAVRVVILRGAGDQAFISGADISEFEHARTPDNVASYDDENERAYAALPRDRQTRDRDDPRLLCGRRGRDRAQRRPALRGR